MVDFQVIRPQTVGEACSVLGRYGEEAAVLAGGTDLVPLLSKEATRPRWLMDIKRIPGLNQIAVEGNEVHLGCLVTHRRVLDSPVIVSDACALADACRQVGSPQIRNAGTVAGNVANASPAADSALALLVLDATAELKDERCESYLPLAAFFLGPGKTALRPGQMLMSLRFRVPGKGEGSAFVKLGKRSAMTISVVSAAARVSLSADGGTIRELRLALGAVAPVPLRMFGIEERAVGAGIEECLRMVRGEVARDIKPITDVRSTREYRLRVAPVIAVEAVELAVSRARASLEG